MDKIEDSLSEGIARCVALLCQSDGVKMMWWIVWLWVVGCFPGVLAAQDVGEPGGLDSLLRSPYHTIRTHLWYLQPEQYDPVLASYTLDHPQPGSEEAQQLAIQLKQIYDGMGLLVRMDLIPSDPNYVDSTWQKHVFFPFPQELPEVYLEKVGDRWLYSRRTVNLIPTIHQQVYPFGMAKLLTVLSKFGTARFLGLALWQYIATLIFVLLAYGVYKLLGWLLTSFFVRVLQRFAKVRRIADEWFRAVARPTSFLIVLLLLRLFLPILQYPATLMQYVVVLFKIAIPLTLTIIAYRIVSLAAQYAMKLAEKTETTLDDQLIPFARKILKVLVVLTGVLFIIDNLGYDITALLAGLSIGGLAVALAAQDTIKNFFGSLVIFTDRPFRQGDYVLYNNIEGTIEDIGLRSTKIRTPYNSLVSVPNAHLADAAIDNLGMRVYRRLRTVASVTYDTPPEKIELFVEALRRFVHLHPDTWKENYQIYFYEMSASSLDILINVFFKVPSWTEELRARHQFLLGVLYIAEQLGISFAFPSQSVYVESFPGQPAQPAPKSEVPAPQLRQQLDEMLAGLQPRLFHSEESS